MEMVNVKVNGIDVSVPKGSTILEAARVAGVEIPTLCYMKEKNEIAEYLYRTRHLSESQIRRCLILPKGK